MSSPNLEGCVPPLSGGPFSEFSRSIAFLFGHPISRTARTGKTVPAPFSVVRKPAAKQREWLCVSGNP
jgi:hypothetical protein